MPTIVITTRHCNRCRCPIPPPRYLRYSCPKCGGRFENPSERKREAISDRSGWAFLIGAFGAGAGYVLGLTGVPGKWAWTLGGFVSWAAMSWFGAAGKSEDGKLWQKLIFWSVLSGGVGLSVCVVSANTRVPQVEELLAWTGIGMATGAVLRFLAYTMGRFVQMFAKKSSP